MRKNSVCYAVMYRCKYDDPNISTPENPLCSAFPQLIPIYGEYP